MSKDNSELDNEKIARAISRNVESTQPTITSRALKLIQDISKIEVSTDSSTGITRVDTDNSLLSSQVDAGQITTRTNDRYKRLEDLLLKQQWLAADSETKRIIINLCERQKKDWLRVKDLEKLACQDLQIIDQLWMKHSSNRFGITIQRELFREFWDGSRSIAYNPNWCKFGELVGWRNKGLWNKATEIDGWLTTLVDKLPDENDRQQSEDAENFPVGHFPRMCRLRVGGFVWWAGAPRFPWGSIYCALMLHFQRCNFPRSED